MLEAMVVDVDFGLYRAALEADAAYHAAVVAVYGEARAGDMRYRKPASAGIQLAYERKLEADKRWLAESARVLGIRGRN